MFYKVNSLPKTYKLFFSFIILFLNNFTQVSLDVIIFAYQMSVAFIYRT